jgi:MFS family permease
VTAVHRRIAGAGAALRELDRALGVLAVIAFITQVGVAIMLPLLPLFAVELGADPLTLGLLTSAFAVANAIGQIASGFLADRVGPRRLIPLGEATYASANALMATASAAGPLVAFRFVAGLGGGITLVSERVYIAAVVAESRLAFANGIVSAAGSAGSVVGPAVGGLLAAATDLRVPFLVVAVTSGIAALLSALLLPPVTRPTRSADGENPSAAEVHQSAGSRTWTPVTIALLAANFGLLAGFGSFITTFGPFGTTGLGMTTTVVGLVFAGFGLGSIALGPWWARIGDRTGRRRMAILACLPIAIFVFVFGSGLPTPLVFIAAVPAGGGVAAFGACWYALLAASAPAERRGRVIGLVSAFSNFGIVAGGLGASLVWSSVGLQAATFTTAIAVGVAAVAMLAVPPDAAARIEARSPT